LAYVSTVIGDMDPDEIVILNMCGRGDKDLGAVLPVLEKLGRM
ncbi:MAG: tryptophan synthase subunit beta, partial [Rhodobacteraceae bacterium]|nr:tryptophan synthase subunit beta [Paracoccaceae bacterium]